MKSSTARKLIHLEVNGKPSEPPSIWLDLNHHHVQKHPVPALENENLVKYWKSL